MDPNMNTEPKLDALTAARMLENIFEESEVEPNTVPAEALAGYEDLNRNSFLPHRIILMGIILLWILLPILFIKPDCEISQAGWNDQSMPVYTVSVTSKMPVNKVTASLDGEPLQVYAKEDAKTYAVEPEKNGVLEVRVTGANRQTKVRRASVRAVDVVSPKLQESRIDNDRVYLQMTDDSTGVDYENVYAIGEKSGSIIRAESFDEQQKTIVFQLPKEKWDLYVPDKRGNTLHISMEIK